MILKLVCKKCKIYKKTQKKLQLYVTVKSYDGKMVRIPVNKKEEYLEKQRLIKQYINQGLKINEILKLLDNGDKNE